MSSPVDSAQGGIAHKKRPRTEDDDILSEYNADSISEGEDTSDDEYSEDVDGASSTQTLDHQDDTEPAQSLAAAYDPEFDAIHNGVASLAEQVVTLLEAAGRTTIRMYGTRKRGAKLQAGFNFVPKKIMAIGETGVGKSTVMNSVIGIPDLAEATSAGCSCSYVAISYEQPLLGQTMRYGACVDLKTDDEINAMLESNLKDYQLYHFKNNSDVSEADLNLLPRLLTYSKISSPTKRSLRTLRQHANSSKRPTQTRAPRACSLHFQTGVKSCCVPPRNK
jgi:hypothetical protein